MYTVRRFLFALTLAAAAFPVVAQTSAPAGTLETVVVHGRSLEGNLDGDSPDRNVIVYLPPSYATDTTRHYPVVYLLHGYGLQVDRWMRLFNIENGLNNAMTGSGDGPQARGMIIVNPDAYTIYDGSFYSSSAATGDWESFIADDLVQFIDSQYRTIPRRESRGLGGHSMGGYGTLRIGLKRADVFGAIYPMSAAGMLERGLPTDALAAATKLTTREEVSALRYPNKSSHARAAAWSANPQNAPFYVDFPVTADGVEHPEIQAKWMANSILPMLGQYVPNMKSYMAIQFDVGLKDNLLQQNQDLDAALTQAGIAHTFLTYDGDHNDHIAERIEQHLIPFFSEHLKFE